MGLEPPMKEELCDGEIVPLFLSWTVAVGKRGDRFLERRDSLLRRVAANPRPRGIIRQHRFEHCNSL
jgi:hypothetical protein